VVVAFHGSPTLPLNQASECQDSELHCELRSFARVYSAFSLVSFFVLEDVIVGKPSDVRVGYARLAPQKT